MDQAQPHRPARVLFVEAAAWEYRDMVNRCSEHCRVYAHDEQLHDIPDDQIPPDVNVLSVFIHSRVNDRQLDRLPNLELVATRSTGIDHIDLDACNRRGITVCNVPAYGENTVAEHTFALLLALTRNIHRSYDRTIRGDFSIEGLRGRQLFGRSFGVIGTGKIGLRVLRIAAGFGMRLRAFDVRRNEEAAEEIGFEYVELDELLSASDIISLHVPLMDQTRHMIDAAAIQKMPQGAVIINTSRGALVDSQALIEGLASGRLGGAALDVLEGETEIVEEAEILARGYDVDTLRTIVRNHVLLRMPNVIITPHVAFNSEEAVQRIIDSTLDNIHDFMSARPRNVVNQPQQVKRKAG